MFLTLKQKVFHSCQQDRDYLEHEIEQTQTDLSSALEAKTKLETNMKKMKIEEEDLQQVIVNLRQQVQNLYLWVKFESFFELHALVLGFFFMNN